MKFYTNEKGWLKMDKEAEELLFTNIEKSSKTSSDIIAMMQENLKGVHSEEELPNLADKISYEDFIILSGTYLMALDNTMRELMVNPDEEKETVFTGLFVSNLKALQSLMEKFYDEEIVKEWVKDYPTLVTEFCNLFKEYKKGELIEEAGQILTRVILYQVGMLLVLQDLTKAGETIKKFKGE